MNQKGAGQPAPLLLASSPASKSPFIDINEIDETLDIIAIPKTRLNAVPWARYTVDSQAQLEKDGAVRHRKLGSLGTLAGAGTTKVAIADNIDSVTKPAKKKGKG